MEELATPWKKTLIIKLLGKTLGFNMMKTKLKNIWRPGRDFDIMDVVHGFFMVNLDLDEFRTKMMEGGHG